MFPRFALFICSIGIMFSGLTKSNERGKRVRRIVGGIPAQLPPADDPVVYMRFAGKSASVKGVRDFPHYVFRGIRFAQAPTGKDRFQRPRQYLLNGDYNATIFPPPCAQPIPGSQKLIGSEDCLFLNVFTPDLPDGTEGLPVIVWIHGGGFRHGSASQYGVRQLVGKRLVLVTIQYRLGTFGFLSTGSPEMPGNAALWDMVLAVQWVRNYIGFFGGNPHKIVVMGHGTGASSALLLALSNVAKGTASAVVAMSGSALSHWAIDNNPQTTANEVAEYNGCPTSSVLTMVKCLQALPTKSIVEGDSAIERTRLETRGFVSGLSGLLGTAPVSEGRNDGRFLPSIIETQPLTDMTMGNVPKIPLLTGIARDETKKACQGPYRNEIISKLQTVPNFLDKVLIQNLQSFTGLESKNESNAEGGKLVWNLLDPAQFANYLQISKNNVQEGLSKISEATADALFNLPAFLTADLWTKGGAPTYLYRFEHNGKAPKGHNFLNGMPLVGNATTEISNDIIGHGDELSYVFEAKNLDGSPLAGQNELSEDDVKVRDIFTQMISDFARFGKISVDNENVPSFSSNANNFVQIGLKPKLANNFRYCEMALWAGLGERLRSSSCQFLNVLDSSVKNVQNMFFETISSSHMHVDDISMKKSETVLTNAMKNPFGMLHSKSPQSNNKHQNLGIFGG